MFLEKKMQIAVAMADLFICKYWKAIFAGIMVFAIVVVIWTFIIAFKD